MYSKIKRFMKLWIGKSCAYLKIRTSDIFLIASTTFYTNSFFFLFKCKDLWNMCFYFRVCCNFWFCIFLPYKHVWFSMLCIQDDQFRLWWRRTTFKRPLFTDRKSLAHDRGEKWMSSVLYQPRLHPKTLACVIFSWFTQIPTAISYYGFKYFE